MKTVYFIPTLEEANDVLMRMKHSKIKGAAVLII